MINLEKVINAIECCIESRTRCFDDKDKLCPYFSTKSCMCEHELLRDALILLKDQKENLEHITTVDLEGDPHNGYWYVCEECHGHVDWKDQYCPHCGWRLDWDG